MILLDAYALVAFLVGGPAAAAVRALLREGDSHVATANLAEALDVSQRRYALPVERAMQALEPLFGGPLGLIGLDLDTARRAAMVRARHYERSTRPISLADAILVASAPAAGDGRSRVRIATADPDVLAIAELEGIDRVPLPGQG